MLKESSGPLPAQFEPNLKGKMLCIVGHIGAKNQAKLKACYQEATFLVSRGHSPGIIKGPIARYEMYWAIAP